MANDDLKNLWQAHAREQLILNLKTAILNAEGQKPAILEKNFS